MPHKDYSLVIIGSGPGIGVHVGSLFASKGFTKIALVARNQDQLSKDKAQIEQAASNKTITVKTYPLDVTNLPQLSETLDQIGRDLGKPEFVFYNAAAVRPSKLLGYDEEDMLYEFKITNTSLHATAKWAVPQLVELAKSDPDAKPSLFVTSSLLPTEPMPDLFSLSLVKAAQLNLTKSLDLVYKPQGVHVGVVIVGGNVTATHETLNPPNIAAKTWSLFDQSKGSQTFSVEIL